MYDKMWCPKCKTRMLVYLGDSSDCTSVGTQAARCPKCGECFLMGDDEFLKRDDLYEIILHHFDSDAYGLDRDEFCDTGINEAVDALMSGKEWNGFTLSAFLNEFAYTETGEPLP